MAIILNDLGFAMKATYCEVGDEKRSIVKMPMTDKGKKSHSGKVALRQDADGKFYTIDNLESDDDTLLQPVFEDGKLLREDTFQAIRARLGDELKL